MEKLTPTPRTHAAMVQGDFPGYEVKTAIVHASFARQLERELAEARKDAERYRVLRRGQHWSVINGIGDTLRADELDAAIDAAMSPPAEP